MNIKQCQKKKSEVWEQVPQFHIKYIVSMSEELQKQMLFQIMYNQLMGQFTTLTSLYHSQNQQNIKLYQDLQSLLQQKIELLKDDVPTQSTLPAQVPSPEPLPIQQPRESPLSEASSAQQSLGHPQKESRIYKCTYPECAKTYRSSVSMNLHIKLKHNGGTKKQRQSLAKMIIQAEERGEAKPEVTLNFPPGFLQQFRNNYYYMKKYNM